MLLHTLLSASLHLSVIVLACVSRHHMVLIRVIVEVFHRKIVSEFNDAKEILSLYIPSISEEPEQQGCFLL